MTQTANSPQTSPDSVQDPEADLSNWDIFVLRHRKRGNLAIHFVSFLVYYAALFALLITWNPWWIAGLFVSGFIGTAGHYIFDDGRVKVKEATFDPMVVLFVTIMFYKIFRRRYHLDIALAESRHKAWLANQPKPA